MYNNMKKTIYFICLFIGLCSCSNIYNSFPDNFPKDKFFSYLPYEQEQSLVYFNGEDTLELTVNLNHHVYDRMEPNLGCFDCIMESAYSIVKLMNDTILLTISCSCTERTFFDIFLKERKLHIGSTCQDTILRETVLDKYNYKQKKMSDDIFNQFTEEIVLFGGAKVKQNIGLVSFTDRNGTQWTLVR